MFWDARDGLSHVGGSVRRGFRFVVWFGAGSVGRIGRIWGAGIPRSASCNVLGWVGVLGGSFGVRYFDSKDLDRKYIGELVKKERVM